MLPCFSLGQCVPAEAQCQLSKRDMFDIRTVTIPHPIPSTRQNSGRKEGTRFQHGHHVATMLPLSELHLRHTRDSTGRTHSMTLSSRSRTPKTTGDTMYPGAYLRPAWPSLGDEALGRPMSATHRSWSNTHISSEIRSREDACWSYSPAECCVFVDGDITRTARGVKSGKWVHPI